MRKLCLRHAAFPLAIIIAVILIAPFPFSAVIACGNVNMIGIVDMADVSAATSYLTGGGFVIPSFDQADMDNHFLYTMMDLAMLVDVVQGHPNVGVCPPALGPLDPPVSANDILWYDKAVMPANQDSLVLTLGLTVSDTCDFGHYPVKILVDGVMPTIDSVKSSIFAALNNAPEGKITLRAWGIRIPSVSNPRKTNLVATVYIHIASSTSDRPLQISFDPDPPVQATYKVLTPMIITVWPGRVPKTPTLQYCCTGKRGNVNMEGIVDSADLALLVAFLTTAGVNLPCYDQANIDGLGIVDPTDLATMVSYLTIPGVTLGQCP